MAELKKLLGLLIFFSAFHFSYGQKLITFDTSKILLYSQQLDLLKSNKRGLEDERKIIYYVEKDLQTLSSYQNGLLKWKINVIKKIGRLEVGKPEIRYIKLEKEKLIVTVGKHDFATININNGKLISTWAD